MKLKEKFHRRIFVIDYMCLIINQYISERHQIFPAMKQHYPKNRTSRLILGMFDQVYNI